jgi:hypothetical protein
MTAQFKHTRIKQSLASTVISLDISVKQMVEAHLFLGHWDRSFTLLEYCYRRSKH